jgi:BMFP domain-containing protein YqiC
MQTSNRIFDDIAKVAQGALSTLAGVRDELAAMVRHRVERMLTEADLVPREEFEAVKEMAATARAGQERLEKRVVELEARLAPAQARRRPAPKAGAARAAGRAKAAKPGRDKGRPGA